MAKWSYMFLMLSFFSLIACLYIIAYIIGYSSSPYLYATTILIPVPAIILSSIGVFLSIRAYTKNKNPNITSVDSPLVPVILNLGFFIVLILIFIVFLFYTFATWIIGF